MILLLIKLPCTISKYILNLTLVKRYNEKTIFFSDNRIPNRTRHNAVNPTALLCKDKNN